MLILVVIGQFVVLFLCLITYFVNQLMFPPFLPNR